MSKVGESSPLAGDGVASVGEPSVVPDPAAAPPSFAVVPKAPPRRHGAVWRAKQRPSGEALPAAPLGPASVPAANPRGAYAWVLPRRLLFFLEALSTALAFLVAWGLLLDWTWFDASLGTPSLASHGALLSLMSILLFVGLWLDGAFSSRRRISGIDDGILVIKHLLIAMILSAAAAFVTRGFGTGFTDYSERVVFTYVGVVVALTSVAGVLAYSWQRRMFRRGEGVRRLIIAGAGAAAAEFERFLMKRRWLGVRCAGIVPVLKAPTESARLGGLVLAAPVLGGIDDLVPVVRQTGAGEVVVALDRDERIAFPDLARRLVAADVPFRVLPSMFEEGYATARAAGLNGLPTVTLHVEPLDRAQSAAKRMLDVLISLAVIVLLAPLLAIIAVLVTLTTPGPMLFRQVRVGSDGRHFLMLKFRSMYDDAEARLGGLMHLNEADGALFKMKDDPRVTPVGRFIRPWSLDELPQFFNVLRGDMSIVGPRPPLPREVSLYETPQLARLKGKPGITGLWQVSGRSDLTFEQMVDLDRYYLEHWSLGLDLSIMLRTALVIVKRRGAY